MNRRAIFRVSKIRLFPSHLSARYTIRCLYNCFEDACKQPEILHFSITIVPCCFCYNFDKKQVFSAFISFSACKLSPWFLQSFVGRTVKQTISMRYTIATYFQPKRLKQRIQLRGGLIMIYDISLAPLIHNEF